MSQFAVASLMYNRPLHSALTLAYLFQHRVPTTDIHVFYSIHRETSVPSKTLHTILTKLARQGTIFVHYLNPNVPQNCGGNVDTLMTTMTGLMKYDCFIKLDDDVLIGPKVDELMGTMLLELEPENVFLLMGQAVRQHMRMPSPFCWEGVVQGHRVVQRSHRACPMETLTAVSPKFMNFLKQHNMSPLCENDKGTFMPYSRKVAEAGGKAGLVLVPAIAMQHIGLCSTIDNGAQRNWAPATSWDPPGQVIQIPGFDFAVWEGSHRTGTTKQVTLEIIDRLRRSTQAPQELAFLWEQVNQYQPGANDVPLPMGGGPAPRPVQVLRRDDTVRANGMVVRPPTVVRRVIVKGRQPQLERR